MFSLPQAWKCLIGFGHWLYFVQCQILLYFFKECCFSQSLQISLSPWNLCSSFLVEIWVWSSLYSRLNLSPLLRHSDSWVLCLMFSILWVYSLWVMRMWLIPVVWCQGHFQPVWFQVVLSLVSRSIIPGMCRSVMYRLEGPFDDLWAFFGQCPLLQYSDLQETIYLNRILYSVWVSTLNYSFETSPGNKWGQSEPPRSSLRDPEIVLPSFHSLS